MELWELDQQIKAVCPIQGVSIGTKSDRTTWRIDFDPSATQAQKDAANSVLGAFDFSASSTQPNVKGFEGQLKTVFGSPTAINVMMTKYPLFLWSLRDENWTYVQQILIGAKALGDINQTQYDAIKAAIAAKNLPVTLP